MDVAGRGDVLLGGLERLEVRRRSLVVHQVVDVVITRGRTMNDKATTIRSTQPHTASPDADKAGLCASTASV